MLFKYSIITVISLLCFLGTIVNLPTKVLAQGSPSVVTAEVSGLLKSAQIEYQQGRYANAIKLFEQALASFKGNGDLKNQALCLTKIGVLFQNLEKYEDAIDRHKQALKLYLQLTDRSSEGKTYRYLGDVYSRLGKYQIAIDYHQQSLLILRGLSNLNGESNALSELGFLAQLLGKFPEATKYYQQALEIYRQLNNFSGQGNTYNDLGNVAQALGKYQDANTYFRQALQIYRQQNKIGEQSSTLIGLGNVAARLNKDSEAIDYFQQALQIARQQKYQIVESAALNNLGNMSRKLGQYSEAIDYYQQALQISRTLGNKANEGSNLANIGIVEYRRRRLPAATNYLQQASDITDSLRLDLSATDKVALFETQLYYYKFLTAARILNRDPEGSLISTERGRARIFTELLSKRLSNSSNIPQQSILTFEQIQAQARSRQATIVSYSILQDYDVEATNPKPYDNPYKLLIHVIDATGKLTVRESLLPKGLDLGGLVFENRSQLTQSRGDSRGIAIQDLKPGMQVRLKNDSPTTRRKIISIDPQQQLVTLQALSKEPSAANDVVKISEVAGLAASAKRSNLRQLHQLLIEPIADLLPSNSLAPVIFIPDGALYEVPFAALEDNRGRYLIDLHTISIAPSLAVLAQTSALKQQNIATNSPSLVIGNPDFSKQQKYYAPLPDSENEARNVAGLFPARLLLGKTATETSVKQWLPQARIAHFATHGFGDGDNGLDSAIVLAPDGRNNGILTAGKVLDLNLHADLVVLSACNTGRGKITGDGVIGLSRSFISAGAASVIVSLWSVDDKATSVLMTDFYRQWRSGKSKAQALRQAMLNTKAKYPDPYYWSSMSLYGEID
jgi:CHAT domain-containing protein